MLFSSYLGEEAVASPLLEGGWFDTADSGRIDEDGFLRVLGRADDLLVTGGENVSPIEVEEQIERFPGVRAACVFAIPDDSWGDLLAAVLVVEREDAFDRDVFAAHLARFLAPYKRPRRIALLPSLPTLPSGKVDRRAVAKEAGPFLAFLGEKTGGA
jgi:O-succinylbenzoic acid--CoA ligase